MNNVSSVNNANQYLDVNEAQSSASTDPTPAQLLPILDDMYNHVLSLGQNVMEGNSTNDDVTALNNDNQQLVTLMENSNMQPNDPLYMPLYDAAGDTSTESLLEAISMAQSTWIPADGYPSNIDGGSDSILDAITAAISAVKSNN